MSADYGQDNSNPNPPEESEHSPRAETELSTEHSQENAQHPTYPFDIPMVAAWFRTNPKKIWKRFKRNANGLLVIATILILCIYNGQLNQMRKSTKAATASVRQAKRDSRLDKRAWVTIRIASITKPLTVGEKPVVQLDIINSGKTPALSAEVSWSVYEGVGDDPGTDPSDFGGKPAVSRMVIGPESTVTTKRTCNVSVANDDQLTAIKNDVVRLYAHGFITYYDAFQRPHRTNFCFRLGGKESDERFMDFCDRGNDAD